MADESTQVTQQQPDPTEPHGEEAIDWEAKFKEAQAESRKWEGRAKENKAKADKWDAYEQEGLSEQEKLAQRAEQAEAELAQLRAQAQHATDADEVAKATGVPRALLEYCSDREAMESFAKEYAADTKVPAAPPAPESRIQRGGGAKTSTRDKFASYFE